MRKNEGLTKNDKKKALNALCKYTNWTGDMYQLLGCYIDDDDDQKVVYKIEFCEDYTEDIYTVRYIINKSDRRKNTATSIIKTAANRNYYL